MHESELLHSIRPTWLNLMIQRMARGSGLRDDFRSQLDQFFDMLVQVLETGDSSWFDTILTSWATAQTQTDLEGAPSTLTRFIKEAMQQLHDAARLALPDDQALTLLSALIPCLADAFEKAAQQEMQIKIAYLHGQLDQVQQTLEKLDRSKSDFIAVAAHELKTPLTLVEGYTAMLRESLTQLQPESTQALLISGIHNGTHRLKAIVDDMIDVSLIDNNLLSLNYQPFWLNRLFNVLRLELENSVQERKQIFEIHPFTGIEEVNFGDPERLLQVFRNLLTNAIKFTPDAGSIIIDGRKLPGFVEVTITDTGIGIDPEDQPLIFEKFTRLGNISLHSSGKTKYKGGGPGLGLHIARGIVEAHGGAVWVESAGYNEETRPGSIFHILLPTRSGPPDDKLARLYAPLVHSQTPKDEPAA
jgi:signal transduction histidine kinase